MTPTDLKNKKRILLRLSKGFSNEEELKELKIIFQKIYKENGKIITDFINSQSYNELERRLKSSVFSEYGKTYPKGFEKHCIYGEYQNTKLFIDIINKLIKISAEIGDITMPEFYGLSKSKYNISLESLVHIVIRHNETINSFINPDSIRNGYKPSSFGFGTVADPMLTLFMALEALDDNDWKSPQKGKNLLCHFRVGGQNYTVIRKGNSKSIKSLYPRNDNLVTDYIQLERHADKMEMIKK